MVININESISNDKLINHDSNDKLINKTKWIKQPFPKTISDKHLSFLSKQNHMKHL